MSDRPEDPAIQRLEGFERLGRQRVAVRIERDAANRQRLPGYGQAVQFGGGAADFDRSRDDLVADVVAVQDADAKRWVLVHDVGFSQP